MSCKDRYNAEIALHMHHMIDCGWFGLQIDWDDKGELSLALAQMGGPAGVRAAEHLSITMSCDKGMKMHVIPRI